MTNMTRSKLSIFSHPGKITGYWITTRSFPYRGPYLPWGQYMGLDFVSGQYGCLFSRCRKYVINSMGISILAWLSSLDSISGQYGGLGMITRPVWKCPCINLYIIQGYCMNIYQYSCSFAITLLLFCNKYFMPKAFLYKYCVFYYI